MSQRLFARLAGLALAMVLVGSWAGCTSLLGDFTLGGGDASTADATGGDGQVETGQGDGSSDGTQQDVLPGDDASDAPTDSPPNCDGSLLCNGMCVPNDTSNCGTCGHACAQGAQCVAGSCVCPSDGGGGGMVCGGQCIDTTSDSQNCGGCGNVCLGGETCQASTCACPQGQALCNGQCIDITGNNNDCGGCGNVCKGGTSCTNSKCVCPGSLMLCSGACVDTTSNNANCGMCGQACPAAETCQKSVCACPIVGQTYCMANNACFDLQTNNAHCGACNTPCAGAQQCVAGKCIAPNYVFVTSALYNGANFGGLAGLDAACQAAANGANLGGTFIGYVSTSGIDAATRIANARGWVRTDYKPVADLPAQLANGNLWYPIDHDEKGNLVPVGSQVATGSTYQGLKNVGSTCSDWTSTSGSMSGGPPQAGYSGFQAYYGLSCSQQFRLYCLQVSQNVALTVPAPPPGARIAFTTLNGWVPSNGLAGADAQCQSEAQGAGLSGTYLALLATGSATAASRFNLNGTTWYRPDNVQVFGTAADLSKFQTMAPINVSADGKTWRGNYLTWGGAADPQTVGSAASTCQNWTSSQGTDSATTGLAGFNYLGNGTDAFGGDGSVNCSFGFSLMYCLQK